MARRAAKISLFIVERIRNSLFESIKKPYEVVHDKYMKYRSLGEVEYPLWRRNLLEIV